MSRVPGSGPAATRTCPQQRERGPAAVRRRRSGSSHRTHHGLRPGLPPISLGSRNFRRRPGRSPGGRHLQITEQIEGSWHDRASRKILLEDWIDVWVGMLGDIGPKTRAKYKYFVEGFILPEFEGRELRSLEFEEIETGRTPSPPASAHGERPTPGR